MMQSNIKAKKKKNAYTYTRNGEWQVPKIKLQYRLSSSVSLMQHHTEYITPVILAFLLCYSKLSSYGKIIPSASKSTPIESNCHII